MRMPEAGPLGETFFEARLRAITGALFVKRSLGGWVESVVTLRTQRFPGAGFAEGVLFAADLRPVETDFFLDAADFFAAPRCAGFAMAIASNAV
jgi:hypothetical protein